MPIARWNPGRMLWETETLSLFSEHSEPFSETFPTSGMTRNGALLPLPTSEPRTDVSVCSSSPTPKMLPTPRAAEAKQSMTAPAAAAHVATGEGGLTEVLGVHLFPTPRATDGTKGGPNQRGSSGDLMLPSAVCHLDEV